MPGEIEDGTVVDIDRADEFAGGDIPELDRPVVAGRGEERAIGGELGVVEEIAMAAEGPDERARGGVAELGLADEPGGAAGDHELRAVG